MPHPYIGQIIMFGGSYAIQGWAKCDGQLVLISQNNTLFNLIGTTYGGDGRTTFGLPDLRGRVPIHQGTGPGLQPRALGAPIGDESATVAGSEMPPHSHVFNADALAALNVSPDNAQIAEAANTAIYGAGAPPDTLDASAVGDSSGGAPHQNVMPFQCITFLIALSGEIPLPS
jgi:microcystin-dependent protein